MSGLHLPMSCLIMCPETSDLWWDTPEPQRQKRRSQAATAPHSEVNEATAPPAYLVSHLGYIALVMLLTESCFYFNLEKTITLILLSRRGKHFCPTLTLYSDRQKTQPSVWGRRLVACGLCWVSILLDLWSPRDTRLFGPHPVRNNWRRTQVRLRNYFFFVLGWYKSDTCGFLFIFLDPGLSRDLCDIPKDLKTNSSKC